MLIRVQRAPEIPASIAAIQLVPVMDALARLGHDGKRVLALCSLPGDALESPYARLPAGVEFRLWEAVAEVTRDPLIALAVAEQIQVGALGAYEYLMRNSSTLRAALEQANRYERVVDDLTRIELIERDGLAHLRLWRQGGYPHPPLGGECLFAVLLKVVEREGDPGEHLAVELRFKHRCPTDPRAYAQRLGHPVRFEQEHDELVFASAVLDRPLRSADPKLGAVLEEHVQRLLAELPTDDPFVTRARGALGPLLANRGASLEALAAALHVGTRTLRRRLADHRTSYKALLDDVRRELAYRYVGETDEALDAVAIRLGFSEPSTFYRAFKRWAGVTPAQYRAQAAKRPSDPG